MAITTTNLGRVQPIPKGNYESGTTYSRLDIVFWNLSSGGNGCSYISLKDNNTSSPSNTTDWQKISDRGAQGSQGFTGGFGAITVTTETLEAGSSASVNISTSGPDIAKEFSFDFQIPAGPIGVTGASAIATSNAGDATAAVTFSSGILDFAFNIPPAEGAAVASVDGIGPNGSGNVVLGAIRYTTEQSSLSDGQKAIARGNIGAIGMPASASAGQYLQYNGSDWVAAVVSALPAGGTTGDIISLNSLGEPIWVGATTSSYINSLFTS